MVLNLSEESDDFSLQIRAYFFLSAVLPTLTPLLDQPSPTETNTFTVTLDPTSQLDYT